MNNQRESNLKIQKIVLSLDLFSNILPFFGSTKDCLLLMSTLCKTTNGYIKEFNQVIMKDILRECKKEVKNLKLNEETIENLLRNKAYLMYELELSISQAEDYVMLNKLLDCIEDSEADLKDSIVSINVHTLEANPAEFTDLYHRVLSLNMDPYILDTYTCDLNRSIPYLKSCILNLQTPLDTEFSVESLSFESFTDISDPIVACTYLNSCKIICEELRVQDTFIQQMYKRRINFSQNIRSSACDLTVRISAQADIEDRSLFNSIKWTIDNQLTQVTDVCFSFDSNINMNMLKCLDSKFNLFSRIEIKECEIFFGDYIQSHFTDIWVFIADKQEWIRFYVKTFRCSYNSFTDVQQITDDYIILKSCKEFDFVNIIKTQRSNEFSESGFEDFNKESCYIVIPKNKIFINHIMNINFAYLPNYNIHTNNILVVDHRTFDKLDEIIDLKHPSQKIEIDLEFYEAEVNREQIDSFFWSKSNVHYITLTQSQLNPSTFDYFLSQIQSSNQIESIYDFSRLVYLEFHNLEVENLHSLLKILKFKNHMLKLVFYFQSAIPSHPCSRPESPSDHICILLAEYKQYRPFTVIMVNGSEFQ